MKKWTSSRYLNFPSHNQNHKLGCDVHQGKFRNCSHSKRLIHRHYFTDWSNHCFSLSPNVQLLSTVSFASQIPNLHSANIWTLGQIWTLSKYSGEYFDSFLKSKHFDSFFSTASINQNCNALFPKIKCPTDFARPCRSLVDHFDSHHRLLSTDWDNVTLQRHKGRTLRTYHSAYVLTFCYSD